jgi:hypothetical protein
MNEPKTEILIFCAVVLVRASLYLQYRTASVIFRLRNNMSVAPRHVSLRPLQLLAAEEEWGLEAEPEDRVELARYVPC